MSTKRIAPVSFRWHLRTVLAQKGIFVTSELVPLLASRGVTLSREQVYRLVVKTPQRLSLMTLSALCDILECSPSDLIEPLSGTESGSTDTPAPSRAQISAIHPIKAKITPDPRL